MPNGARRFTNRSSRPLSLSTIGSNEEADFTRSRNARQTAQSTYSISSYLQPGAVRNSAVSGLSERYSYTSDNTRRDSIYSPAEQRESILSHKEVDRELIGASEDETRGLEDFDLDLEKPEPSHNRPGSDIMDKPEPERAATSLSMSSSEDGAGPQVKYMKTRYMWMLLQLDQIPWWHNLLAAASSWIVLAAYLVLPGTFTSLSKNQGTTPAPIPGQSQADDFLNGLVNHLGLLAVSGILAGIGALNCIILYFVHWQNYVWLSGKIFQPMTLNAFAGLLTTIVNVYTAQNKVWSPTAQINAVVTGAVAGVAGGLFLLYNFWLLDDVKKDHRKYFPVDAELVDPMKKNKFSNKFGKYLREDSYQ